MCVHICVCLCVPICWGGKWVCLCVCVCGYIHKISGTHRDQKKSLDPLKLDLSWVVRPMTWALRSELSL